MDVKNDEHEKELLHSEAHIWNCMFNFINSFSLKCAVELGIPDIVHKHGKPMTISELSAALPINQAKSHHIFHLMRILVHMGFFIKQKIPHIEVEEGYILTPASRLLLKDEPSSVASHLLTILDPVFIKPWYHVSEWFGNNNKTTFDTAHGSSIWDFFGSQPRFGHLFDDAMARDSRLVISVVLKECRGVFEDLNSLIDVGGGTGTVARAISDTLPNLNCTVLDLPHVVAGLKGGNNLSFVGGDMFVEIPPADAVLLKWILHNWSDEESVKILKKCKEAIPSKDKGGKVIIIDINVDIDKGDETSIETQLFWDMLMMVLLTGKQRNENEWAKLFHDAGFSDYKITPILGLRSLIEVYP